MKKRHSLPFFVFLVSFAVYTISIGSEFSPSEILSPIFGDLEVVSSLEQCSGAKWCFNQHKTGYHHPGGGVSGADDTYAWDANLNTPSFDSDKGKPVYAVEQGFVAQTYGSSINAGGSAGQVLIMHEHQGNTWWSGYLHLTDIKIIPGQEVHQNTLLGYISSVGTDNNHLHFVVYEGQNVQGSLVSFDTNIIPRSSAHSWNDLTIASISFSDYPPTAMMETTVYLTIENVGGAESPPGNLEVTLLVFSANGKPFQGNIIDLGEIESISPGESLTLSFPYTFISHAYSEYLEVELHPEHGMDSNLTNNTRQMDLILYPNSYAYYNCIGELITIASAVLLDGVGDIEFAKDAILYAYARALNFYGLLTARNLEEQILILYETAWDTHKVMFKLTGEVLLSKLMSYLKLFYSTVKAVKNEGQFLGCGEVLPVVWETLSREIPKRRWEEIKSIGEWVYWYFVDSPADLIVEDGSGNITSVVGEVITEGIENSFGIEFEGHRAVIIIGNDIYTLKVQGTDIGECGLSVFKPNPDADLVTITYGDLPTTDSSEAILIIGQEISDYTLNLDNDGDGVIDETRTPDTAQETIPFTIPLITGWNLISTPVHLLHSDIEVALQSIAEDYHSVWAYDSIKREWQRYVVNGPDSLNNLEVIEPGRGYWIRMISPSVLTLEGYEVANEPIPLKLGWNLVGYNSLAAQSPEAALSSIGGEYTFVWNYDVENKEWERCLAYGPEFLNNLGTMDPGKGYWICVEEGCEWVISP